MFLKCPGSPLAGVTNQLLPAPKASEIVLGHLSVADRAVPLGNRAAVLQLLHRGEAEHGPGDLEGQRRDRISRGREKHSRSSVTTVVDGFCSCGCTEHFAEGLRAELLPWNV